MKITIYENGKLSVKGVLAALGVWILAGVVVFICYLISDYYGLVAWAGRVAAFTNGMWLVVIYLCISNYIKHMKIESLSRRMKRQEMGRS